MINILSMASKNIFQIEFPIRSSLRILFNQISTPSGLSEWFADNVNLNGKNYTFFWNGDEQDAELLSKKNNCKFKIDFHVSGESFLTKPNRTIHMAKNIIKKVTKTNPVFSTTGGTSDARFIKKISPCLEFGLVNKTMHKVDECVSLKDLKNLTKIYQNILEDYFR